MKLPCLPLPTSLKLSDCHPFGPRFRVASAQGKRVYDFEGEREVEDLKVSPTGDFRCHGGSPKVFIGPMGVSINGVAPNMDGL